MLYTFDKAGFTVIDDPYKAEFVIAHSGGCLLVPDDLPASKVILIGPVYWPGRSIFRSTVEKNVNDFIKHRQNHQTRRWAKKVRWNLYYFWNIPRNVAMLRALKNSRSWNARNITVVRNAEDRFCTPNLKSLPFTHGAYFVKLPGQHDDLWSYPERYTNLLH